LNRVVTFGVYDTFYFELPNFIKVETPAIAMISSKDKKKAIQYDSDIHVT